MVLIIADVQYLLFIENGDQIFYCLHTVHTSDLTGKTDQLSRTRLAMFLVAIKTSSMLSTII